MPVIGNADIRKRNRQMIANCILRHPGISQQDLQKQTGISLQTINGMLKEMEQDGLICRESIQPAGTAGRPPMALRIAADGRYSIGAAMNGRGTLRLCMTDLLGKTVAVMEEQLVIRHTSDLTDGELGFQMEDRDFILKINAQLVRDHTLSDMILAFLAEQHLTPDRITSVVLALPGALNGTFWRCTGTELDLAPFLQSVREETGIPVTAERGDLMVGQAESWLRDQPTMLHLWLDYGMSSTFLQNGVPDPGISGHSGSVGHMLLHPGGRKCICGRRGCSSPYLTAFALLSEEYPTLEQFFAAAKQPGSTAETKLKAYLRDTAACLCSLTALYDRPVLISGVMAYWLSFYEDALRGMTEELAGDDFSISFQLNPDRQITSAWCASVCAAGMFFTNGMEQNV